MKKRLNILCIIILVMLAAHIIGTFFVVSTAFASGFEAGLAEEENNDGQVSEFYTVRVFPTEMTDRTAATLTDYKTKRQYKVWPASVAIKGDSTFAPSMLLTEGASGLTVIVASIVGLVAFVKFVRNVNRDEIFTKGTIRHLRCLGWCFLISSIALFIGYGVELAAAQGKFNVSGYTVSYEDFTKSKGLLFAIFTFIIAEAFAIAKNMKEEQELTI